MRKNSESARDRLRKTVSAIFRGLGMREMKQPTDNAPQVFHSDCQPLLSNRLRAIRDNWAENPCFVSDAREGSLVSQRFAKARQRIFITYED
jgi:hypothetical protein